MTSKSVNLLGVTPLDFGPQEHVDALIQNVEQAGWKVLSTWAMGDTLEDLGSCTGGRGESGGLF